MTDNELKNIQEGKKVQLFRIAIQGAIKTIAGCLRPGFSNYEVRLTGDWFIPSNVVKLRRPPGNPREHIKTLDKQVKLKRKLELQEYVEAQEASMEHRRAIFKSHCLGLCEAKRNMKPSTPLGDNRKIQVSSDSATSPADSPTCMRTQVSTDVACPHRSDRCISSVLNPFAMDLYIAVAAAFIIVVRRCLRTGPYPAMFPIGGRETETLGTLFDLLPPDTRAMFPCIRRQGKHRRSACIWRLSSSGNACNMHSPVSKDTTWLKERNSLKAECLHDGGPILFTQSLGELESMMWQIADFVSPAESIVSLAYGGIIQIDPPVMEAAPHCLKPGPYLNQILICIIQIDPPVMEATPHCLKPGPYLNHILVSLKPGQHLNHILVSLKPGQHLNQILVCIIHIDPPVMEDLRRIFCVSLDGTLYPRRDLESDTRIRYPRPVSVRYRRRIKGSYELRIHVWTCCEPSVAG
uniref:Uncharacterized protein n=1 Tax=Timema tahoe TaxID=61484 RepID=A0A7R9FJI4_9NEOP|nr:unnamed protein product [Timema tahoe]